MSPGKSLLVDGGTLYGQSHGFDDTSVPGNICTKKSTYSIMIKLIEGSLTEVDHWNSMFNKDAQTYDSDSSEISSMTSIAAKVAKEDDTKLDLKQGITYESLCSMFLLQLVNDCEDYSTSIGSYFANAAASNSSTHSTDS